MGFSNISVGRGMKIVFAFTPSISEDNLQVLKHMTEWYRADLMNTLNDFYKKYKVTFPPYPINPSGPAFGCIEISGLKGQSGRWIEIVFVCSDARFTVEKAKANEVYKNITYSIFKFVNNSATQWKCHLKVVTYNLM